MSSIDAKITVHHILSGLENSAFTLFLKWLLKKWKPTLKSHPFAEITILLGIKTACNKMFIKKSVHFYIVVFTFLYNSKFWFLWEGFLKKNSWNLRGIPFKNSLKLFTCLLARPLRAESDMSNWQYVYNKQWSFMWREMSPFLEQLFMEKYRNEKDNNVGLIVFDYRILELEDPTKCKSALQP